MQCVDHGTANQEPYDHFLFIGFGAPGKGEDVEAFLKIVASGRSIPEKRLKEVSHHYERMGGGSPYNDHAFRVARDFEHELRLKGIEIPVYTGMRNWNPFLCDTLKEIAKKNLKKGLAFIFSPFRSTASCQRYKINLQDAIKSSGAEVVYDFVQEWLCDSSFIDLYVELIHKAIHSFEKTKSYFLFSAHSIPEAMNEACSYCNYANEHARLSAFISDAAALKKWSLCYQSRSGKPEDSWLGPDIQDVIKALPLSKDERVVVIPTGFMLDNAEVLYDLDIEARAAAEAINRPFLRVETLASHPGFSRVLCDWILNRYMFEKKVF